MLYVIAKIDKSARARLSWIQSFAASFGIVPRPIYGHITLVAFEGDEAERMTACKGALADQTAFSVDFRTVDILRESAVVAALAAREGALDAVQEKLAAVDPDHLDPGFRRESWTPHTVLLRDRMVNLNWVRMAMNEMFQPFTAKVERIEFMVDSEVVDGIDLKGEEA